MRRSPATFNIIIISVLVWLASVVLPSRFGIDVTRYLGLHYWLSDSFMPHQLLTYIFMHDTSSFGHIFCNMFGLWMFGSALEQIWGAKKFVFFYLVAGVGAGVIQELTWMIDLAPMAGDFDAAIRANSGAELGEYQRLLSQGDITQATAVDLARLKAQLYNMYVTVGASGSLFGVMLGFGWLFPGAKMMLLFLPIPIPSRVFVGLYAVVELFLGVAGPMDGVAHFAHLGGMIFGAILLLVWKRQGKLYS